MNLRARTPIELLVLIVLASCSNTTTSGVRIDASDGGAANAPSDASGDALATKCIATATYDPFCAYDPGCPVPTDFESDTLPTGACTAGDTCKPIVRPLDCGCPRVPGVASFYECNCVSGQWACTLSSQNGATCDLGCSARMDASADASADASDACALDGGCE